jgi:hypothetical protein
VRRAPGIAFAVVAGWLALAPAPVRAQVLIWSLPKQDGTWVRFEGTHKQSQARPNLNIGDEMLEWRSELTISSVGTEMVEGAPARWVEFKSVTKPNDLEKPAGPGGTYVYKVLIPENRVIGKTIDDETIPVTFLPIIKGYRKVGDRDVEPVAEKALAVYPRIALITFYPDLQPAGEQTEELALQVSNDPVAARVFKGTRILQRATERSTNSATLWLSDQVPFGLAKYQVTLTREEKNLEASADEFQRMSLIEVEMSAVAQGGEARSELADSN